MSWVKKKRSFLPEQRCDMNMHSRDERNLIIYLYFVFNTLREQKYIFVVDQQIYKVLFKEEKNSLLIV